MAIKNTIKNKIKTFIILSFFAFQLGNTKCLKADSNSICKAFFKEDIKISSTTYKDQDSDAVYNKIDDFERALISLRNNPVFPIDSKFLTEKYGCIYEPLSHQMKYVYTFHCNYAIHEKGSDCNKKVLKKTPKICKSSCQLYYDSINSIFNDTNSCPPDPNFQVNRDQRLKEIQDHCKKYASDDSSCIKGTGDEEKYCGFNAKEAKNNYCENVSDVNKDECCKPENERTNYVKYFGYVGSLVAVILVVVLIVLKLYSTNKNKRDEVTRAETEALEKKREEERERYREQLQKEFTSFSSDSPGTPLINKNIPESPYTNSPNLNSPHHPPIRPPESSPFGPNHPSPRPPQQAARISPLSPQHPPQRTGSKDSPSSNASRPPQYPQYPPQRTGSRDSPSSNASRPPQHPQHPPQRTGSKDSPSSNSSRPPQHPQYPPQRTGSKDSPSSNASRPPQHNGSRDSPRNNPRSPHIGQRNSPGSNATRPPQNSRESPRNSPSRPPHNGPRNSPGPNASRPPHNGPRNSPGTNVSRPPPSPRPHLPSNNNRY